MYISELALGWGSVMLTLFTELTAAPGCRYHVNYQQNFISSNNVRN